MKCLLLYLALAPAFSNAFFYRPITSGTCEDAGCSSMSSDECKELFENMKQSSKTANSPTVRYYLEETNSTSRPSGCLADFNLTTASLRYNEGFFSPSASISDPVYCICDNAAEFVERENFYEAVEWCNGWLGDVEIDPTRSWIDANQSGTPRILISSLGGGLDAKTLGLLFQPGLGFSVSSVVSIGIHFAEIPFDIQLSVSLSGCRETSDSQSTPRDCDREIFSDRLLSPGMGDVDMIYFVDLEETFLNPDWSYFLEFAYPPPLPTRDAGEFDIFWSVRLPLYHPLLQSEWDYVFEDTTYFRSVKPFNGALYNGWWDEPRSLPRIVFKFCTSKQESPSGCSTTDLLTFRCNQWLGVILLLAILIFFLCCFRLCCRLSPQETGNVCLNFVEFKTGNRWYRKGVPLSHPIKLLTFDVADMLELPRTRTSLWLRSGKRLKWCYTVGDYEIDSSQDIFILPSRFNYLCACWSIEDVIGPCFDPPNFDNVPIEQMSRRGPSARLIAPAANPAAQMSGNGPTARLIVPAANRQNITQRPRY